MNVRRVVTGHDASGKSVFVSDEAVGPVEIGMMPQFQPHLLWGGDETPQFPDDGTMPAWQTYFPPIGGFRFGLFSVMPDSAAAAADGLDMEAAASEVEAKLPGLLRYMDVTDPGMHTTDTIDFEVVLEGTIVLELDDGAEVTLHPGDTVVQNGTRHRWRNPGDTPARLALFICGASHAAVPRNASSAPASTPASCDAAIRCRTDAATEETGGRTSTMPFACGKCSDGAMPLARATVNACRNPLTDVQNRSNSDMSKATARPWSSPSQVGSRCTAA